MDTLKKYLPHSQREWITVAIASLIVFSLSIIIMSFIRPKEIVVHQPPPLWSNIGSLAIQTDKEPLIFDYILLETQEPNTNNYYYLAIHKEPNKSQIALMGTELIKDNEEREGVLIGTKSEEILKVKIKLPPTEDHKEPEVKTKDTEKNK